MLTSSSVPAPTKPSRSGHERLWSAWVVEHVCWMWWAGCTGAETSVALLVYTGGTGEPLKKGMMCYYRGDSPPLM